MTHISEPVHDHCTSFFLLSKKDASKSPTVQIPIRLLRRNNTMTSKELLYVEDALGHEQYFQAQCCETASRIQDSDLKQFAQDIERRHKELFRGFYGLL